MQVATTSSIRSEVRVRAIERIAGEINLPLGVAVWVIGAHLFTLISPLSLVWVAGKHAAFFGEHMAHPSLLYVGTAVMMVGSALEIAQNTFDRWYLTADTASALLPSLVDCAFYTAICTGLLLIGIGVDDTPWVVALMALATLSTPVLYLLDIPHHGMSGLLGAMVTFVLYRNFGDPTVFLFVVIGGSTGYFFSLLLKTLNQSLHGFTAIVNGVGMLVMAYSLRQSALAAPSSWFALTVCGVVYGAALIGLYPVLSKLPATRRRL